jgi:hypothetical protein
VRMKLASVFIGWSVSYKIKEEEEEEIFFRSSHFPFFFYHCSFYSLFVSFYNFVVVEVLV